MNLAAAIAGAHEAAITADMQRHAVPLDAAECDAIARLRKWCQEIGVSSCPCKPLTLAAFIRSEAALGVAPEEIATTYCGAISELHNHYGHANPTATTPVRLELSRILKLTPPRSWPKKIGSCLRDCRPKPEPLSRGERKIATENYVGCKTN